jgi:hypothetical protein
LGELFCVFSITVLGWIVFAFIGGPWFKSTARVRFGRSGPNSLAEASAFIKSDAVLKSVANDLDLIQRWRNKGQPMAGYLHGQGQAQEKPSSKETPAAGLDSREPADQD